MITIQTLSKTDMLEGLPDNALAAIANLCHEKSFSSETIIFAEGHPVNYIYLLQEGTILLFVSPTSRPTSLTISLLKSPGQAFGWSAVIGSGYYTAAAQAMSDVRAIALDGQALVAYLEQNSVVGYQVMKRVAHVISYRLSTMRTLVMETVCD
ncbi:MAG: Crp/Fnr family transcriptional regulator [Chloroflexi bacterium]|nr:Crp/Fnr family transcriptional regulator [Chloroflexota bacterium]